MHVGCTQPCGLGNDAVDQADDRRIVLAVEQIGGGDVVDQRIQAAMQIQRFHLHALLQPGIGVDLRHMPVEHRRRQRANLQRHP